MNGLLADLKCKTGRMSRYKSNPLEPTSRASIRHLVIVFVVGIIWLLPEAWDEVNRPEFRLRGIVSWSLRV